MSQYIRRLTAPVALGLALAAAGLQRRRTQGDALASDSCAQP